MVDNDIVAEAVYNKLVTKINNMTTMILFEKVNVTLINQVEKQKLIMDSTKIPNPVGLVKKTYCKTKITEIEGKIYGINRLLTATHLNTVGK